MRWCRQTPATRRPGLMTTGRGAMRYSWPGRTQIYKVRCGLLIFPQSLRSAKRHPNTNGLVPGAVLPAMQIASRQWTSRWCPQTSKTIAPSARNHARTAVGPCGCRFQPCRQNFRRSSWTGTQRRSRRYSGRSGQMLRLQHSMGSSLIANSFETQRKVS